ncbi:hypothetical protein DL96DRAFT_81545 [Flagelloscypha sp. PMI_526]|nr:hypothetical protein DL96DRAFT_81545 [Flagelloscypha sp. PMI_526]
MPLLLLGFLLLPLFFSDVSAFNFNLNPATPASCDKLSVSWTGGTAPFTLNLIPVFGTPRALSIPATAQGSFDVDQLPFAAGQEILITMSDSTGFGAGGVTTVIKVGAGAGKCVTKDPGVDFSFQLPTPQLQQCQPYTFSGYDGAVKPVQILGLVPGGQPFTLSPGTAAATFDWTANAKQGTSVLFMMVDSKGRQGGSSKLLTIGASANQACLNANSPSSTPAAAIPSSTSSAASKTSSKADNTTAKHSATKTATSQPSSTSEAAGAAASGSSSHAGAIAGAVIGVLIMLGALISLFFFYRRRLQQKRQWSRATPLTDSAFPNGMFGGYPPKPAASQDQNPFSDPPVNRYQNSPHTPNSTAGLYTQSSPLGSPYTTTAPQFPGLGSSKYNDISTTPVKPPVIVRQYPGHELDLNYPPPPSTLSGSNATYSSTTVSREISSASSGTIASQEKAITSAAQRKPVPRFVLHTDAEDEIEELPPQYSDRRALGAAAAGATADTKSENRPVSTATVTSLAYMQDAYAGDSFTVDNPTSRR